MGRRPRVGLALGAGSARGLAHLGVLQVLEEEQIPIDMIAGSSIGSMVGAFYAIGHDLKLLSKMAVQLNANSLLDLGVPRLGFVAGRRISEFLYLLTKGMTFADLKVPLGVVATDLELGEMVVIREGSVAEAVRASISIPGVFQPVELNGRLLVDGAVTESLPAGVVREMGADIVIGVDVSFGTKEVRIRSILDVFWQSIEILERQVFTSRVSQADVLIQPAVCHIGSSKFDRAEECIKLGIEAARQVIPQIKEMIETWRD